MGKKEYIFSTGIKALDKVIDGVQAGDNIVFQVNNLSQYVGFVHSFCIDVYNHNIPLIYFRFADHENLMPENVKAEVFKLKPENGFEPFITEILAIIKRFGYGACYVFDSLSELAVDWYSDRMLSNFFRITCPYLYVLKTVTYFALLKNNHGTDTIKIIQNTAQVILDVHEYKDKFYLQPIKVFERYSPTMYMLQLWDKEKDQFIPVKQSAIISGILSSQPQGWLDLSTDVEDSWLRTFQRADHLTNFHRNEIKSDELNFLHDRIIRMAITREPRLITLVKKYATIEELIKIGRRMIGTGLIGGKSVGMLLARFIVNKSNKEKWNEKLEIHDSFFIGSDVFYTYLCVNDCWWVRHKLKTTIDLKPIAKDLQDKILKGVFSDDIIYQFKKMLEYFGQSPIIVRSSSLLEDAYGNAFSGKYESYFLTNQGDPEKRLQNFMQAVRKVYASTVSMKALKYRIKRGLFYNQDEQMAILVMRVSGCLYKNNKFFPQIAGVGYSYNPYAWNEKIDPDSGMIRLVFGLGTRAVDRSDDDYTRIVALNAPQLLPSGQGIDQQKYSQRKVDVLDFDRRTKLSLYFEDAIERIDEFPMDIYTDINHEFVKMMKQRGITDYKGLMLTFRKLLNETNFCDDMREILRILQEVYEHPVDIEFAANFLNGKDIDQYKINLLQCRPFQFKKLDKSIINAVDVTDADTIFKTKGPIIGQSVSIDIDKIIYVVPEEYGEMNVNRRYDIASLVGKINALDENNDALTTLLMGPGRWGTSSPSLGVPVSFSEINNVSIICEIQEMHDDLCPDVSLGTHFFNDLVEMNMLYIAIDSKHNKDTLNKEFFKNMPNHLTKYIPNSSGYERVIKLIVLKDLDDDEMKIRLNSDTFKQKAICYIEKKK